MEHLICVLGAVKEEIAGVKKEMHVRERMKLGRADGWLGRWQARDVLLVRTGVGKARAQDAIERVLKMQAPACLVSIGYAGGLNPGLQTGDLLLADKLWQLDLGEGQGELPAPRPVNGTPYKVELPELPGGAAVHRGGLVTVDRVVTDAKLKRRIGEAHPVLACDMETGVLAEAAEGKGIRFVSLRAISDTVDEALMDVSPFLKDGEVSTLKAGWYVVTHPGSLKTLKHLKDVAQLATANLTRCLKEMLKEL